MSVKSTIKEPGAFLAQSPKMLVSQLIPMRDGVSLCATIFLPAEGDAPVPVVLQITPYGRDAFVGLGKKFTAKGMAFALVDCRGRGDSGGSFEMFETDINDGPDVIDWLSRQSWCDGQVAMYGGSYSGINQWIAAKSRPQALKAIAPWGAGFPGLDTTPGGIPFIGHVGWYVLTANQSTQWQLAADGAYWARELAENYRAHGSALDVAARHGVTRGTFAQVLEDPFYALRAMTFLPTDAELAEIDLPILSSTGHFDSTHAGTLRLFQRHMENAGAAARDKHHLVIGPWHHAGMDGTREVGGLTFGPQAAIDFGAIRMDWYRWVFGLGPKPEFLAQQVMYYMAGAENWRGAGTLADVTGDVKNLFPALGACGAGDIFHSGTLKPVAEACPPSQFVVDPFAAGMINVELGPREIPRPVKRDTAILYPDPMRGLHLHFVGEDPTDQAFAYDLQGQGVIYHASPVDAPFEIAGIPELDLWLTLSAPDTDLIALLYEILPGDGQSILLWSNMLRLRYRRSWRDPVLAEPGVPFLARFNLPRFVSRRISAGSRLRLVVRTVGSIYFQKNLNSGKPVHLERPADARRCDVQIHHDPDRQTTLRLPLAAPTGAR